MITELLITICSESKVALVRMLTEVWMVHRQLCQSILDDSTKLMAVLGIEHWVFHTQLVHVYMTHTRVSGSLFSFYFMHFSHVCFISHQGCSMRSRWGWLWNQYEYESGREIDYLGWISNMQHVWDISTCSIGTAFNAITILVYQARPSSLLDSIKRRI